MKVRVEMEKEPSRENYINILRNGNELLRSKESRQHVEKAEALHEGQTRLTRLLRFGRKAK